MPDGRPFFVIGQWSGPDLTIWQIQQAPDDPDELNDAYEEIRWDAWDADGSVEIVYAASATEAEATARRPSAPEYEKCSLICQQRSLSSPPLRLLALQCALRADTGGSVRLPAGLLRGMRLHSRNELWDELEHAAWLRRRPGRHPHMEAQLLDVALLHLRPDGRARARAVQWALHPAPVVVPVGRPSAVQLTALALASHTPSDAGGTDLNALARQCGYSPQQTAELLDRLVASQALAAWRHNRGTNEVFWWLPRSTEAGH
ncbi:hypothetical protein ACFXAW_31625 [Streptomyces sp. NPDC059445]|uniref:hypothetical protein n=1 Tax=Streptomyces sp. NPDC059445 TaxID=3346832 RepID=UPI0036830D5A